MSVYLYLAFGTVRNQLVKKPLPLIGHFSLCQIDDFLLSWTPLLLFPANSRYIIFMRWNCIWIARNVLVNTAFHAYRPAFALIMTNFAWFYTSSVYIFMIRLSFSIIQVAADTLHMYYTLSVLCFVPTSLIREQHTKFRVCWEFLFPFVPTHFFDHVGSSFALGDMQHDRSIMTKITVSI